MATRQERQGDKALNEKHTKILKELMARPDNRKCTDCGKKDPRWASWNLGIFFCINCSGVHRSIGTHITKVKSADLDTWTPEQVENMIRWGNAKANYYWEHDLPKNFQKGSGNVDAFIRDKYERKKFALRGDIPDPSTINLSGAEVPVPRPKTAAPQQDSTQQLFSAFQNAAPTPAPVAKPTPTDQLFEAFQSAPVASQPPKTTKDSILSLYSTPQAPQTTLPPTGFAAFQSQNSFTAPTNFAGPPTTQTNPQQNFGINTQNNNFTPSQTDFGGFASTVKPVQKDPFADFGNFGATSPSTNTNSKPKDDWSAFE
ncbi:hypothetical protein HDV01_006648 [Terramyces sp. JEL0728]|nr:hypothetical protein HDV01_006648 [Terramyces sp. JEL0728]